MAEFVLHNARLMRFGQPEMAGYIHVVAGRITAIEAGAPPGDLSCERVDGMGKLVTPGLVDIHTHGVHTYCYDQGPDALRNAACVLARYGTTCVVPTLIPMAGADLLNDLAAVTQAIDAVESVEIPGIHIEGPFVALAGAACDTRPGDLALLDEILDACNDKALVMSIAPEVPNIIAVIERLMERGVVPFMTHTRASVEETVAAIDAGARHATHFYDVFPVPEEKDPGVRPVGVVETVLADSRVTCDFICDGVHVHPMAIRAALAAKGSAGVALITDASFGAGLPPGRYETPWGYPVDVKAGDAPRIADPEHPMAGALAGSALTMNRGIANLRRWLYLPDGDIWAMGSRNPARIIGAKLKGTLENGMDADFVLWDEDGEIPKPVYTWIGGRLVYDAAREAKLAQ